MESNSQAQTERLWKVFRTAHQMACDRGYNVSSELNIDLESFKRQFAPMGEVDRDQLTSVAHKKDDPTDILLIFFAKDEGRVAVKTIRDKLAQMTEQQIRKGICIYRNDLSVQAKMALRPSELGCSIEAFKEQELLVNVTHHKLVPKHELLSDREKADLMNRYRLKPTQLPLIRADDPVARYYGLKPGQVVKILRKSETAGRYVSYRLCSA